MLNELARSTKKSPQHCGANTTTSTSPLKFRAHDDLETQTISRPRKAPKMAESKKPAAAAAPKSNPAKPPSSSSAYLFVYNFVSSVAWATVLGRTLVFGAADGVEAVYPGVGRFARLTQTMACLEVLHSLFGRFCTVSL